MEHDKFMERCIILALNGSTTASPNPMVGSVIVLNNKIIGEGWHHHAGAAHAEVNAISSVKDQSLLKSSTLYVNLEPCAHYGKTPPCCDLIIEKKIPEVVIGSRDPFKKVDGAGILRMKEAGIKVTVNVLYDECIQLNKRFFHFHQNKRPYIFLKWAQTADGFIDKIREGRDPHQNKISGKQAQLYVHQMRATEDAILVGAQTVINDNPALTTRLIAGKNPIRILIDPELRVPEQNRVFKESGNLIIVNLKQQSADDKVVYIKADTTENIIPTLLRECYERNILSLMVEGGSRTLQSFIDENYWDEAHVIVSDKVKFQNGLKAPKIIGALSSKTAMDQDQLYIYKNS